LNIRSKGLVGASFTKTCDGCAGEPDTSSLALVAVPWSSLTTRTAVTSLRPVKSLKTSAVTSAGRAGTVVAPPTLTEMGVLRGEFDFI
jgi:hypothetical protein